MNADANRPTEDPATARRERMIRVQADELVARELEICELRKQLARLELQNTRLVARQLADMFSSEQLLASLNVQRAALEQSAEMAAANPPRRASRLASTFRTIVSALRARWTSASDGARRMQ